MSARHQIRHNGEHLLVTDKQLTVLRHFKLINYSARDSHWTIKGTWADVDRILKVCTMGG